MRRLITISYELEGPDEIRTIDPLRLVWGGLLSPAAVPQTVALRCRALNIRGANEPPEQCPVYAAAQATIDAEALLESLPDSVPRPEHKSDRPTVKEGRR